ncbi:MAG: hypothetical protein JOZ50_10605 [Candidatus Eremiobacteraeota bacterium]|nr:hypothetical protein [Candidatus Eremiobacteraeota bacterium]
MTAIVTTTVAPTNTASAACPASAGSTSRAPNHPSTTAGKALSRSHASMKGRAARVESNSRVSSPLPTPMDAPASAAAMATNSVANNSTTRLPRKTTLSGCCWPATAAMTMTEMTPKGVRITHHAQSLANAMNRRSQGRAMRSCV